MIKRIIVSITLALGLLLAAGAAKAQDIWNDPGGWSGSLFTAPTNGLFYNAQELQLDLFGSYVNPESRLPKVFDSDIRRGAWGGGAGLQWYFTRNLGLGGDLNLADSRSSRVVEHGIGDVYLRLPLGNSPFAVYGVASGGRAFVPAWDWIYGGGPGFEMRFSAHLGLFADARYLWSYRSAGDRLNLRTGLRIVF